MDARLQTLGLEDVACDCSRRDAQVALQAYELVESNCSGRPILMRLRIVRTTFGMSEEYFASDCAIDAMINAA